MKVIPYEPDRKQAICSILARALGTRTDRPRDERYWTWKHERNPFGPSLMLLAEEDNHIVGVRAFMRWEFEAGGIRIVAGKPVDSVTDPDYQRRGIFSKLTAEACRIAPAAGMQMLFNTPNKNSLPGYLKLGWHRVGRLPVRLDVLSPCRMAWRFLSPKADPAASDWLRDSFNSQALTAAEAFSKTSEMEDLLDNLEPAATRLSTQRKIPFLNWRYAEHPHEHYFAETCRQAGRLDGLLIYRLGRRHGWTEVLVNDAMIRAGTQGVLSQLVEALTNRVRADYLASHGIPRHAWKQARRSAGFKGRWTRSVPFVARPLDTSTVTADATCDLGAWQLCLGDLEGL